MCVKGPLHEQFEWLELIGFILLVAGTLVYNEIVVVPFWGFDKNTRAALEKRKQLLGSDNIDGIDGAGYMGLSPGAAYDANRNKRILDSKIEKDVKGHDKDDYEL